MILRWLSGGLLATTARLWLPVDRTTSPGHDGLLGDRLGRGQVFLHEDRRQGQDVADVVEAVADVVGGEVVGRPEVDADQVADGVVVLDPVEPPDRHAARVDVLAAIGLGQLGLDPAPSVSTASRGGWGRSSGGIRPDSTFSLTLVQSLRFWAAFDSS